MLLCWKGESASAIRHPIRNRKLEDVVSCQIGDSLLLSKLQASRCSR